MSESIDVIEAFARQVDALSLENAKLREELAKARDPQRIGGQADPSSFAYAIEQLREFRWQHATNDEDAIPYINNVAAAHERENAKLRCICGTSRALCPTNRMRPRRSLTTASRYGSACTSWESRWTHERD